MLKGKNVVIGVSGGIAAYKACDVVSRLRALSANVDVIMTTNAAEFVSPLTFESLSGNAVTVNMFNREREWEIEHIALAKKAHCFCVVPATANIVAKYANGIADDMLSTTLLAARCPILFAPAMNTAMYTNTAFTDNLERIKQRGALIVEADSGRLACGDVGAGKLASVDVIVQQIVCLCLPKQDYANKRVLITAGGTEEPIDAVRFITNRSSGAMGIALAERAATRGAKVTLVLGKHSVTPPNDVEVVSAVTTKAMYDECLERVKDFDVIIKAAAPADYRVENYTQEKHKEDHLTLSLVKNPDIAAAIGLIKGDCKLVIFCAETSNLIANAKAKLVKKHADLIVANDVLQEGAGFNVFTNIVTLLDTKGNQTALPKMSKGDVADAILDKILLL